MSSNTQTGLVISPNNPFKEDIIRFQKRMRESNKVTDATIKATRVTVTETIEYFPGAFTKLYQNREMLKGLSMEACKILVHIGLMMEYEREKIKLSPGIVCMERRRFSRGILDLLLARILVKEKREWYWINVTVMIVGRINKHDE